MPRLFVALEIPQAVKDDLARLAREVPEARWVPPEQNHLTLRFIGDVEAQQLAGIKKALAALHFARFMLELHGVGHFPPGRRPPRVLWLGISENRALFELQQRIELGLLEAGVPPEERPFSPHLTLARLKEPQGFAVASFEERHRSLHYPPVTVAEFVLFSSVLTPKGAIHRKELAVPAR